MRSLLYVVLVMAAVCCGCSRSMPESLERAERLMLTDPSAAMDVLNGVDVAGLADSASVAHWALLYSEAMVANRVSAPTDTIVNIAIDYYRYHGQIDQFQRASELKALIQANSANDPLASALYLQKEKEYLLFKEQVKRRNLVALIIFLGLFCIGLYVWMRQRMRIHKLENETLIAEASGLRNRVEASQLALHELLDDRFELIDSLCQTYYETQGTPLERKAIVDKVKSEIESVRVDSLPRMERLVNECQEGLLEQVKEKYPEIKPEDYQLLVYLGCGLSLRTISLLLGENIDVIYKRKSRLKSRLKERTPQVLKVF